ncbi:MAG: carbonic anhydrase [Candidatus Azotimanducaceae bacterium]|jgi:carbonic anhydrase
MQKHLISSLLLSSVLFGLAGAESIAKKSELPVTEERQSELTPEIVLEALKDGNARFVSGKRTKFDPEQSILASSDGQFPKAYVLSCVDSRVPVEMVFDQGIGDIFVGRVAGNIENEDQLGSMEFASAVAGIRLIVVLGHEACGAVKGACDHVELGNITRLIEKIAPAVRTVEGYEPSERNSKNPAFVEDVIKNNVLRTVADIRERSPLLAELEAKGSIKIVGAYYSLQDGAVKFL